MVQVKLQDGKNEKGKKKWKAEDKQRQREMDCIREEIRHSENVSMNDRDRQ